MRLRRRMIGLTAALIPVVGVLAAQPAAADAHWRVVKDFTFTYRGQPLTCTVVGDNSSQYNDAPINLTIYYGTELVDEKQRCHEAARGVSAGVSWRGPGGTHDESFTTDSDGTRLRGNIWLEGAETATSLHSMTFACDDPGPGGSCHFRFGAPVFFQPK
jgi:hypothetical protein